MRYKIIAGASAASCLGVCATILFLSMSRNLTYYIHPRYIVFTVTSVACAMALLAISWLFENEKRTTHTASALMCLIVTLCAILFPPQALTNRTAQNRLQDVRTINSTEITSFDSFSKDYGHFDIADWSNLLNSGPQIEEVAGKSATVEGFILKDASLLYVARFRLTCCAVDATPLTIPISSTTSTLLEGRWYRIDGKFVDEENSLRLLPSTIIPIEEPNEPYIY